MLAKRVGRFRRSARLKIVWARAGHPAHRAEAHRNHAAVGQSSYTNRDIDMIVDEIDDMVGEHQPRMNVGIGFQEIQNNRRDMQFPEHDRGCDGQVSARGPIFA